MNIRYLASQSRKLLHTYFLHIHMHHKHQSVARCDQLSDFPNDALKSHPLHCSTCFLSSRSSQASGRFQPEETAWSLGRISYGEYFEIALFVEFWRKHYDGFRLGSIIKVGVQHAPFLEMAFFPSSSPSMFFKCICCRIFNFQPYHWAIASNNLIPNNSLGFPPQPSSIAQIDKPELAQSRSDKT